MASALPVEGAVHSAAEATQTLLTRFAVALNRRRAYRPSHPMVVRAEQQLLEAIHVVMASREELKLGVGPRELLLDGQRVKSRLAVTREVAARLHRRGVSSLTLKTGINRDSVRSMLGWLTGEAGSSMADINSGTPELPGFAIGRIPYDRLVLIDSNEDPEEQVASLWSALGSVAFVDGTQSGTGHASGATSDSLVAEQIAAAIRGGVHDDEYASRISGMLFTLVDQATHATPRQRAIIGERLRAVLLLLDDQSLASILTHVGSPEQQRRFMAQVAEALPLDAVVNWLEVAARTSKRDLSHHLLRLLRKLSTLARGNGAGSSIDTNFRDAAHDLVSGWDLDDPNPGEHVELLEQIALIEADRAEAASASDVTSPAELIADKQAEAARLVQMALEIDAVGEDTFVAVQQLMLEGSGVRLLEWISTAKGTAAPADLRAAAASSQSLPGLLLRESPDVALARELLPWAREDSIAVLFDVLAASNVRMIRRLVYDRLREFGRSTWGELLPRLDSTTWFFARNLLGLMREIRVAERDAGGNLELLPLAGVVRYLSHEREQLRLEAVRLLVNEPSLREGALKRALDDASVRIVREALESIIALAATADDDAPSVDQISPELCARVLQLVSDRRHPDEARARAVWALDACNRDATRDWLIAHVTRKRLFSRRPALVESSPTVLAALGLLAKRYRADARVMSVLAMAKAAGDLRSHAVTGIVAGKRPARDA